MRKFIKKTIPMLLIGAMVLNPSYKVTANSVDKDMNVRQAYNSVVTFATENNISLDLTFQQFHKDYKESQFISAENFAQAYIDVLEPQIIKLKSSGSDTWYYNTGTTLPSNATPNYSQYNLLSTVKKGDIVYEANGGFGITGHIAVVEGLYYNSAKGVTYVRVIEAISDGVVRSVLDDTRVNDKDVSIYRVKNATTANKTAAVNFCVGEIGSSYSLDFAKDTSSSETNWYCSELAWAAYKNQGIDIETTGILNEPGITPRDISRSSAVTEINFH